MFPSWAVMRSISSSLRWWSPARHATQRSMACAAFAALFCCATGPALAEENPDRSSEQAGAEAKGNSKLVLGVRWGDPACAERLQQRTRTALTVLSLLGDFDCRLSSEALSYARPGSLVVDGPFEDTLLNIPVRGQAHVEGTLSLVPVADQQRATIDVHVYGTARLEGSGTSHRVRIESDAAVTFHAVKRIFLDTAGVTSLPASCTAETDMVFKEIKARQPKLLGKFAERIAHQKVADSHEAAETECSAHVVEAICAAFDRELEKSAKVVNTTLGDFLAAATEDYKAHWQRVRFRTATDSVWISRERGGATQFAQLPAAAGCRATTRAAAHSARLDRRAASAGRGAVDATAGRRDSARRNHDARRAGNAFFDQLAGQDRHVDDRLRADRRPGARAGRRRRSIASRRRYDAGACDINRSPPGNRALPSGQRLASRT